MRTKKLLPQAYRLSIEIVDGVEIVNLPRARRIDAAIRAEAKKAFTRGRCFEQCKTPGKCDVCRKNAMLYGVKL